MAVKFIATTELGRLSKWLRILGYDVVYYRPSQKSDLFLKSLREDRLILTRDSKLSSPARRKVLILKSTDCKKQLKEVIKNLDLNINKSRMFLRCVICNELLKKVSKVSLKNKVPPFVFKAHKDFRQCRKCKRVYWQGSHWFNVSKELERYKN